MPILLQVDEESIVCWHDLEFAFREKEVRYMFDTALRRVAEVGSYTCALESVEDVKRFMQVRFLGPFVKNEFISQTEAEEVFHEKEEKVAMSGMR